jgi:hypothetical protein
MVERGGGISGWSSISARRLSDAGQRWLAGSSMP